MNERTAEARRLIADLRAEDHATGELSAISMLVVDAIMLQDLETLRAVHSGLNNYAGQRIGRGYPVKTGRVLQLVNTTMWALRRSPLPVPGTPSGDGDATGGGPYLPGSAIEEGGEE